MSGGTSPKPRRKKIARKFFRSIMQNEVSVSMLSKLAIWYLKLVIKTNKFIVEPEDAIAKVDPHQPFIVGVWHGQHILLPALPIDLNGVAMISRNFDGEITARTVEAFGNETIRASGGRVPSQTLNKGGMLGFLEMMSALSEGKNVVQTADIPKGVARRVGLGIVNLAKRSGRPILPLAIASSRKFTFTKAWDKAALNMPFGTTAICVGEPLSIGKETSEDDLEDLRNELQNRLNTATQRAYELAGKPE